MLKKHSQLILSLLIFFDMVVTAGAWLLAYYIKLWRVPYDYKASLPANVYFMALLVIIPVCSFCYRSCRLYVPRREGKILEEAWDVFRACLSSGLVLWALTFLIRPGHLNNNIIFNWSREVAISFIIFDFMFLVITRSMIRTALRRARRKGWNLRHVLIVGAGKLGQSLAERMEKNAWTGLHPVGFLDDSESRQGKVIHGLPILGTTDDVVRVLREKRADQLFIALPLEENEKRQKVINAVAEEMVDVRVALDLFSFVTLNAHIGDFDGLPIISLRESPYYGWNRIFKRAMDVILSLVILTLVSLPMLIIAILIKIFAPGPIFYKQKRMGLDGKNFDILKFRTMRVDAEKDTGAVWATENDHRRTKLGAFLRETSLDELPQFFNVLKGEMSIVGPRPERPEFIEQFKKSIPKYMLRHKVKAGITGWAQVNGWRGNTSLEKRIQYDLYYIEHWSIWFDLWIMLLTPFTGFVNKNAY